MPQQLELEFRPRPRLVACAQVRPGDLVRHATVGMEVSAGHAAGGDVEGGMNLDDRMSERGSAEHESADDSHTSRAMALDLCTPCQIEALEQGLVSDEWLLMLLPEREVEESR